MISRLRTLAFGCTRNAVPVWSRPGGSRGATGDAGFKRMTPFVRVCAIGSALMVAGCSSWTPSWDFMPSSIMGSANVSLTIESDPPGADAKTSIGPSCRTPCMIPVAADREFSVTYSLNGYLPQAVVVTPRQPDMTTPDVGSGAPPPTADLSPNPVYVQLQLAPPPPVSRKGRGRPVKPK